MTSLCLPPSQLWEEGCVGKSGPAAQAHVCAHTHTMYTPHTHACVHTHSPTQRPTYAHPHTPTHSHMHTTHRHTQQNLTHTHSHSSSHTYHTPPHTHTHLTHIRCTHRHTDTHSPPPRIHRHTHPSNTSVPTRAPAPLTIHSYRGMESNKRDNHQGYKNDSHLKEKDHKTGKGLPKEKLKSAGLGKQRLRKSR